MSVFEVACMSLDFAALNLPSTTQLIAAPYDQPLATLRAELTRAVRVLSNASGHPFYFLQDLQTFSTVYYIGRWHDKNAYVAWEASEARKELLDAVAKSKATLAWRELYTVLRRGDIEEHAGFPSLPAFSLHRPHETAKAKAVSIARSTVAKGEKETLEKNLGTIKARLEQGSGFKVVMGWSLPADTVSAPGETNRSTEGVKGERDELVILSGWTSPQQRDETIFSETHKDFDKIREWVKWFERRMAVYVNLH